MAFESLSDKLQNVFKNLRSKGKLTESDVKTALKEVKMALLEADVSFKVVKQFMKSVQERAVGAEVMNGLNPGQMVIKIVNEELVSLMGSETKEIALKPGNEITVIMMAGLQGAGKTTTTAKLAAKLKSKGRVPLLAACDVYRPAAIQQLQINGEKVGVEVFSMGDKQNPVNIAKAAIEHAKSHNMNVVFLDTAGRLHVDEDMMNELVQIKEAVHVDQTLLVVDAMTGQDAVNVSQMFNDKIGIDGVILTKLDGDTRGGAALSIKATCGKPILYAGMGEKLSDLEQFYPDRMASRILGMGDVMTLIEKAQANLDESKAREMEQKLKKASFGFDDYLESMNQMKNMGGISSVLSMMPGFGGSKMKDIEGMIDESALAKTEAIILSMTPKERSNPDLLNPSRKKRIAAGAGVDISEVNRLVKQFEQSRKMMKQLPGMMGGKMGKRGKFKLPF
ncbi:Fifty-four homolog [uncultured Clostridium sp.]|uniref:Signal recognition particle protein n=1 Tax=Muricoprocola aceti TaxID=2981772 RepID=A0ABT2SHR9_9FIRM|nr:signal recognition particle protein [Muricoprocola aceti]MCI7227266.1 signal recognition particle protein [Lachnospiraceae bacterium]MCQ4772401.1 signal recognition particle protein [Lacrimispora saccharolytica]SCG96335.1 Fifty-four homolog [uncultured Clostridium sp.]MCU6723998.1 signal recognition particle protein [Muricoprocola aceti]MDD7435561.1 signal recognition particle protein [Lachnospiraceae bacterium]